MAKSSSKGGAPRLPVALTSERYRLLKRDVQQLFSRADAMTREHRVRTLWRLGQRITRERIAAQSPYHNSVLRDLSRETNVSLRNLQYGVTFHRAFPTMPKDGLSWGHYRLLLDRPTAEQREHYLSRAITERLSVHQLAAVMTADLRAGASGESTLPRPTAPSYLYAATLVEIIDGDTLDMRVDLGFHIELRQRFRLANIDCPELTAEGGRAARDFVYERLLPAKTIVLKSIRTDIHGRYLADLFYSDQSLSIDACFHQGHHLNELLIEAGHAVPWS